MRTEMEEQFYTTLFHFIITWCNNTNKYNWRSLAHLCWKEHIPSIYIYIVTKILRKIRATTFTERLRKITREGPGAPGMSNAASN